MNMLKVILCKILVLPHLLTLSYNILNIRMSEVEEKYLNIFSYLGYSFFICFCNRFKNRVNYLV